jgi:hypothetical protein
MMTRGSAGSALFVLIMVGIVSSIGVEAAFYEAPSPIPIFRQSSMEGVSLDVKVNATTLHPGQRLNITVSLYNNLVVSDYLHTADNWTVHGFPVSLWPGCLFSLPVDFTIIRGNLTLPQVEAMGNGTGAGYFCMEGSGIDHVIFRPQSSEVTLTGTYCGPGCFPNQVYGPYHLISNFTVNGYWGYPLTSNDSDYLYSPYDGGFTFRYPEVGPSAAYPFEPGMYTLAVADEWGQTVLIHFMVD